MYVHLRLEEEEKEKVMYPTVDVHEEHVVRNIHIADDFENHQGLTVRRRAIWKDTLRCLSRPEFVYDCGLTIRFIGEAAVHAGGPLR